MGHEMIIRNLTNSPFSLLDDKGKKVHLPARGEVSIIPHPLHAQNYRTIGYFKITEDVSQAAVAEEPSNIDSSDDSEESKSAAEEYQSLVGKKPDGRWSDERLAEEIEKLKNDQ